MEAFIDDSNTDVTVLTESWLSSDISNDELLHNQSNFAIYRADRVGRRGGGVLVLIKSCVTSFPVPINTSHEILCVNITLPTSTNILVACYRAPDCDSSFIDDLYSVLLDLQTRFPHANYIICGDFNFPDIDWNFLTATSRQAKEFLNLTLNLNLTQSVSTPTRGANILDLVLVSKPELAQSFSCIDGISDHRIILFTLSIPIPLRQPSRKYIRDYSKANFNVINTELENFYHIFARGAPSRSVDENWLLFKQKITALTDKHVPLICIRGDAGKPWYTNHLRRLSQKKKRLFRTAKKSKSTKRWKDYFACLRQYNSSLKRSKKQFFHTDLLNILRSNPKKFWNLLKPGLNQTHNISLMAADGSPVPLEERSNTMNSYFSSVFTHEPQSFVPTLSTPEFTQMPPITISVDGIAKLINNLKLSSAPGPDNINAKVLKGTIATSSRILFIIFNQSLSTGILPSDWNISKVTPIFKAGNRSDPSNYRPISLTCIACKLLEHIIYSNISCHLEINRFFYQKQHGFRPGLSCETQLFEFTTDLHLNLDSSFQTDVVFLDFSKAFDRVPHQRLLSKLSCLRLDPLTLSWIRAFLTNRSQFTVIAGQPSSPAQVLSGVPQGSVLGPLLFLIYINDISSGISSTIRLFADDCVIYRRISNNEDQILLQKDLQKIENWCSLWLMTLNLSKCKFMHVTRCRSELNYTYTLMSTCLSLVESYRYLGILLTTNLTWSEHILKLVAEASQALGYIRRNLSLSPPTIRKMAYETFIRTKLEYASAIWNPHQSYLIDAIESVQNRAARFITSKYDWHLSVTDIKASLSLPSLTIRREIGQICLFHKLYYHFHHLRTSLLLTPSRYSRRLFNSMSIQRLHGSSNAFNMSFLPRAIEEWNKLPDSVVRERNPTKFKELLLSHLRL